MDTNALFDKTIDLAQRALDLRSRRHEVLLSNIANADTPGYKAFDLMVEEAISRQTPKQGQLQMSRTDADHLPAGGDQASTVAARKVALTPQVTLRGDGNTVDMDREMSALAANQLQYRMSTQLIAKKFHSLHNIIKGDRQ